jgi:hypothetical protein
MGGIYRREGRLGYLSQLWHVKCITKEAPRRTSLGAMASLRAFPYLSEAFRSCFVEVNNLREPVR